MKIILFEKESIKFEIQEVYLQYTLFLTSKEIVASNKMLWNFSPNDITLEFGYFFPH